MSISSTTGMTTNPVSDVTEVVGTVIFRPLEAKIIQEEGSAHQIMPYVKIRLGWHSGKSSVANTEGTNPKWIDNIVLERAHSEGFAKLKIKDQNRSILNDRIGEVRLNMDELCNKRRITEWFKIHKGDKEVGEIHLDMEYHNKPIVHM